MKLREIIQEDYNFIHSLTNNPNIYKFIRDGKPWGEGKVTRFVKKCLEDQSLPPSERDNFYFPIESDKGENVGLIGISNRKKRYSLTVFIDPCYQGQGYFSKSLTVLLQRLGRYKAKLNYILAQVHTQNDKMNAILSSKFEHVGAFKIGEIPVNEFRIYLR
jgi:RimJ/RimL family protein N-acetyltransferase